MTPQLATLSPYSLAAVSILGTQTDVIFSYDDAIRWVKAQITNRRKTFCVAINPEKVHRASRDLKLRAALDMANLRICDGVGVSLASWLLHGHQLPRCTGVDLFMKLIQTAEAEGWGVFFLGASPESNASAVKKLCALYPRLRVAGRMDGFFEDSGKAVRIVNESQADMLFVAMGSPRQEYWISEHLQQFTASFCMGVGGSFDIVSGTARRAPAAFRNTGTEWFYRLMTNPTRVRRQAALPLFAMSVVKEWFRKGRQPLGTKQ